VVGQLDFVATTDQSVVSFKGKAVLHAVEWTGLAFAQVLATQLVPALFKEYPGMQVIWQAVGVTGHGSINLYAVEVLMGGISLSHILVCLPVVGGVPVHVGTQKF